MPQMKPLNWFILSIISFFMIIYLYIEVYYTQKFLSSSVKQDKKKFFLKWMW